MQRELILLINPDIYQKLRIKFSKQSDILKYKYLMDKLKDVYFKDIIHQNSIVEGQIIDYYYFVNLLQDVKYIYKNIKRKTLITKGNQKLRHFQNIINDNIQVSNENLSTIYKSKNKWSYFETTFLNNLVYKLESNNDYDIKADNYIRELYYEIFQTNIIDVNIIYSYIAEQEGHIIIENSIESQDIISSLQIGDQNVSMSIRYARDKTVDNIGKKVQRKHNDLTPNNIPYSIKLIKDWKRMSISFNNEYDMYLFITNKKKLFGDDFTKEVYISKEKIIIRIYEIKNGFYDLKSDEESGDYRDVKIIYEIILIDLDLAFFVECQINLETLITYKKVDHILYDFERAREIVEIVKSQKDRFEWMEGNSRAILEFIRIVLITIAISSIGISFIVVLTDINLRLKTILHANQFIQVRFIEGHYPNNVCYSIDNLIVNCVGYTKISNLIQKSIKTKFKKLISDGKSILGIDSENNFINYNLKDYKEITINENIYDIKYNFNLICYSGLKNIYCHHKIIKPNLVSAYMDSTCVSSNNILNCTAKMYDLNQIPSSLLSGVDLLSTGLYVSCASKPNLFLCWGININGLLDIPDELKYGVTLLAVGNFKVCAGYSNFIICWGNQYDSYDGYTDTPDEIKLGADIIKVALSNACATKSNKFYCWGMNLFGNNDIPAEYKVGVSIFALNISQVCAYNDKLQCWGEDKFNIASIPSGIRNISIDIIEGGYMYMCVSNSILFDCWGDEEEDIKYYMPPNIYKGVDQIAAGLFYVCISKGYKLYCYGSEDEIVGVSDDNKFNWSLPTIEFKISYATFSDNTFCLIKGTLICYSKSFDSIEYIDTPEDMIYSNNFLVAPFGTICGITESGRLTCWNRYSFIEYYASDIPSEFNTSTEHFGIGLGHICASTSSLIDCWGLNDSGQTDIPSDMNGVKTLSAYFNATCASTETSLKCWGSGVYIYFPPVPENLSSGVDEVRVGDNFACALKNLYLYCWGSNVYGEVDVPGEFENGGVELLALGRQHACAQNELKLLCWGGVSGVLNYRKSSRVDQINSSHSTNCAYYNDEWVCWGQHGIPQRLNVSDFFMYNNVVDYNIANDYDICLKYDNYIECRSNLLQNERSITEISVNESFICMFTIYSRPYKCYVDSVIKSKFTCFLDYNYEELEVDLNENFSHTGDSDITKISCGTNHGCALFSSGEVHCFGGSEEYDEASLSMDMMTGAYDVIAGQNSTCILNSNKIICRGKDIDIQKDGYSLSNLKGLDEIIKINS